MELRRHSSGGIIQLFFPVLLSFAILYDLIPSDQPVLRIVDFEPQAQRVGRRQV